MEPLIALTLQGLGVAMALMSLVWVASLVKRDVSIVDVVWGLGFVALAWFYRGQGEPSSWRQLAVPLLVTVWGLRLALHIAWRSRGKGEDFRYAAMRERIGPTFAWSSLVIVFWLQAVLCWLVAMPLAQVQVAPQPLSVTWLDGVGLALFAVGFFFETVGDLQLARFKADPDNRGGVMDRGLWRYTRHPNYFGDAALWWGLGLLALSTERSAWSLVGPAIMTVLLMKVSGVSLLEKSLEKTKPRYRDYVRRTSAFFPWPPRSG